MEKYIEKRAEQLLTEAKEELELCNLEWDDNFLDLFNYTPDFDFGEETNAKYFYGCMFAIRELSLIIKNN